jgi:glyoxalase family protein
MRLNGIHHISAITGDALRNVDFYTGVLGLRLVAKTVNQDDPGAYHLFYGDEQARPGADLTFFEYPGAAPGRSGAGVAHRIAWRVASPLALAFWEARLNAAPDAGAVRRDGDVLRFEDFEGLAHTLVVTDVADPPLAAQHPEIPPEHALLGFHGVHAYSAAPQATAEVLERIMGATALGDGMFEVRGGSRGSGFALEAAPEWARHGAGVIHHVAFATNDDDQPEWDRLLRDAGIGTSGIVDRHFFRSVYFREPGGLLFELATEEPGFTVTGPEEEFGTRLFLPPWLEHRRAQVEGRLVSIPDPRADWPGRRAAGAVA